MYMKEYSIFDKYDTSIFLRRFSQVPYPPDSDNPITNQIIPKSRVPLSASSTGVQLAAINDNVNAKILHCVDVHVLRDGRPSASSCSYRIASDSVLSCL